MAIDDVFQVVLNTIQNSEVCQNVLSYKLIAEPSTVPPEKDLADAFIADVLPEWRTTVSSQVVFSCLQVQKVFPLPIGATLDSFISLTGFMPGDVLPATVAALIRKKSSGYSGRGKQGRVYIAGVVETDQEDGQLLASVKTRWDDVVNKLLATLTGPDLGQWDPGWTTKGAPPLYPITGFKDWDFGTILPRLANQRRRRTPNATFIP